MPSQLVIHNDGADILATNYWSTPYGRTGKILVSVNARAFRVLIPAAHAGLVAGMRAARGVAVSRGPCPAVRLADAFELLWDDGTARPVALHLSVGSFAGVIPARGDMGRTDLVCSGWIEGPEGPESRPVKAFEKPCRYRAARALPDLRPWDEP
jgi:hypothetical protein